jgi:hypothetical protein
MTAAIAYEVTSPGAIGQCSGAAYKEFIEIAPTGGTALWWASRTGLSEIATCCETSFRGLMKGVLAAIPLSSHRGGKL